MFLCAVVRPRHDANGVTFDGKIGIWPFLKLNPAVKKSKKPSQRNFGSQGGESYKRCPSRLPM